MPDVKVKNEFVNANNAKDKFKSSNINKEAIVVIVKYTNGVLGMGHVDDHKNLLNIISKPINEGISKNGVIRSLKVFYNAVEIDLVIENIRKQFSDVAIEQVKVDENSCIFKSISHEYVNKEDYKSFLSPKINDKFPGDNEMDYEYVNIPKEQFEEQGSQNRKSEYGCRMQ